MYIDKTTGLLREAECIASPNCDERPNVQDISLLVIHNISLPPRQFATGDIQRLFTNSLDCTTHSFYQQLVGLEVSAHILVQRSGAVQQFVPFHKRAWHAGKSCFNGRERCNDFSIGIELEGCDDIPYEEQQYEQLFAIIRTLFDNYPAISQHTIVGHSDIAPDRKTDPGPAFDWHRLHKHIEEYMK